MVISMHSHSGEFCRHAKGSLASMVERARRGHFMVYGLSEHVARYHEDDRYPEEADVGVTFLKDQFDRYLCEARRLQKLADRAAVEGNGAPALSIVVGAESEFIRPSCIDNLLAYRPKLDYVVGSLHHCDGTPIDFSKELWKKGLDMDRYLDAQHVLLERLKPEVVGHFDLPRIFAENGQAFVNSWDMERVKRNIKTATAVGSLFEVNTSAWRKGLTDPYPCQTVMQLVKYYGGMVTLSDDAHQPGQVGYGYHDKLLAYLDRCGVSKIHYLHRNHKSGAIQTASLPDIHAVQWFERQPCSPDELLSVA